MVLILDYSIFTIILILTLMLAESGIEEKNHRQLHK